MYRTTQGHTAARPKQARPITVRDILVGAALGKAANGAVRTRAAEYGEAEQANESECGYAGSQGDERRGAGHGQAKCQLMAA